MTATIQVPRVNRWERRRNRTRNALMRAALELFRAKGFDATTIEEITEAADVSPRTFFHHFETKEEVLFGGHRERREEVIAALQSRLETEAIWPAIRDAMLTVVDAFEADPDFFLERAKLYSREPTLRSAVLRINDKMIEDTTATLAACFGVKTARAELLPRLIANLANGALRSAIDTWVAKGGKADLRTLATDALDAIGPAVSKAVECARPKGTSPRLGLKKSRNAP